MKASFKDINFMSDKNAEYLDSLDDYIQKSMGRAIDKMENFSKYVPRSDMARFLARYEIFKKVLEVQGSVIECGVLFGGGLMTWAQLSAILEPANHQRRIIGFDTFSGFSSVSEKDRSDKSTFLCENGSLSIDSSADLKRCIEIYDMTRYFNHIEKVELVKGDVCETANDYLHRNPHLVVSLLYLDMDIYEPTKKAIEVFFDRIPKGGIIAFDEVNQPLWPGETLALRDSVGIGSLEIRRLPFGTGISYAVKE